MTCITAAAKFAHFYLWPAGSVSMQGFSEPVVVTITPFLSLRERSKRGV